MARLGQHYKMELGQIASLCTHRKWGGSLMHPGISWGLPSVATSVD